MATAATSPATLVHPPTPTWRPCAPAQISACATGAMAIGATAAAVAVNSAAARIFIANFLLLDPAHSYYRARQFKVFANSLFVLHQPLDILRNDVDLEVDLGAHRCPA